MMHVIMCGIVHVIMDGGFCLMHHFFTGKVGPRSCGKTSLVHLVAQLTGNRLEVMAMNSAMDTTELLGGFEQVH